MRSAYSLPSSAERTPLWRRANALALTLIVHLLLLLMLLKLTPTDAWRRKPDEALKAFELSPDPPKAATAAPEVHKAKAAAKLRPAEPVKPPPPVIPPVTLALIPGLEHFDLRQVHSSAPDDAQVADSGSEGKGQDSASAYGPGAGPGGARLYNAEWYREPTSAELSFYLPQGPHVGWGAIACQTVERYHVDNCRVLGDSPAGSGFGRAVREAAWQFLVRPPRIDGKAMIGAWVSIRIDYTEGGASARSGR